MLATLKHTAFGVSRTAGLSARVGRSDWRRARLLILCYHGVSIRDEHEWDPLLYVSGSTFTRRLALIRRRGCSVMALGDALTRLYAGDLPERAVVITFDDGYADFFRCAYPALQEYSYPVTVYLTTQRCEHNYPIPRLLTSYLLWKRRGVALDGRGMPGLEARLYPLTTPAQRKAVFECVCNGLSPMRPADKDGAVEALAARLGADYQELRRERLLTIMNPSEVAAAAAAGVDIQLHTHRHRAPEDPEALVEELTKNRDRITKMTGTVPTHFCYPSGCYRSSYPPRLRELGIVSATTCDRGLADAASDRLRLPRFLDGQAVSDDEFEGWLTGVAAWMPRRWSA